MKIQLRPVQYNVLLERELEKEVRKTIQENLLLPIARVLKSPKQNASLTALEKAIKNGIVQHDDTKFVGVFSKEVSREINRLGGRYNKVGKFYKLSKEMLPMQIRDIILNAKKENEIASKKMLDVLNDIEPNVSGSLKDFAPNFLKIIKNTIFQVKRSFSALPKNIKTAGISYEFTDEQIEIMAQQYSNNMNFYIRDFTQKEIQLLRNRINIGVTNGESRKGIETFIMERFSVSNNKAQFLARQETSLCVVSQKTAMYKTEGITKFKWKSTMDAKTRPLHKELNNHIFDENNLPIIDERTGERGWAGQAYNCRCNFIPVIDI